MEPMDIKQAVQDAMNGKRDPLEVIHEMSYHVPSGARGTDKEGKTFLDSLWLLCGMALGRSWQSRLSDAPNGMSPAKAMRWIAKWLEITNGIVGPLLRDSLDKFPDLRAEFEPRFGEIGREITGGFEEMDASVQETLLKWADELDKEAADGR